MKEDSGFGRLTPSRVPEPDCEPSDEELIAQAYDWIVRHDFGHPTAEGIISKLAARIRKLSAALNPSPSTPEGV